MLLLACQPSPIPIGTWRLAEEVLTEQKSSTPPGTVRADAHKAERPDSKVYGFAGQCRTPFPPEMETGSKFDSTPDAMHRAPNSCFTAIYITDICTRSRNIWMCVFRYGQAAISWPGTHSGLKLYAQHCMNAGQNSCVLCSSIRREQLLSACWELCFHVGTQCALPPLQEEGIVHLNRSNVEQGSACPGPTSCHRTMLTAC
ncbi:hypothetical protein C8Q80DRAFT_131560 [Daedaleopsis nitida]|nr:hypothetical protein C8Q80DRAFT_131560 [Daedaleopsis nitida]